MCYSVKPFSLLVNQKNYYLSLLGTHAFHVNVYVSLAHLNAKLDHLLVSMFSLPGSNGRNVSLF